VLLNFIFTTCSSICPLTSRTLEEFQRKLGREASKVHLMSISIDPEEDTPARLTAYARQVSRRPRVAVLPVTLMRATPGKPWLRIEGFVTPDELVDDYRKLLASL